MAESMVEKVAKDIAMADLNVTAKTHPDMPMERLADLLQKVVANGHYDAMARAAIEAIPLEKLLMAAYVRGVEWNEENPLDREYRFKAAGDYADKTISAALNEEVAG